MTPRIPAIPRNAALLIGMLLLILVTPSADTQRARFVLELMFDLILLSGVHAAGVSRHRWAFGALTAVTLAVRWSRVLIDDYHYDLVALSFSAAWLVYATWIIVGQLFQRRDVTIDTILGAINVYLLIAVAFMMIYQIIELHDPGSFAGLPTVTHERPTQVGSAMLYFSFVCLTTMGFGDIVPASDLSRPLVVMEGVIGQLYLAIMIARLVGLHISRTNG